MIPGSIQCVCDTLGAISDVDLMVICLCDGLLAVKSLVITIVLR